MKTKKAFVFLLLMAGMICQSLSYEKTNVSSTSNDSNTPNIAIDSKGKIMVVWAEMDWPIPDISDVLYATKKNGEWSEIKETLSQLYDARSPHIFFDSNGKFHIAYDDGYDDSSKDIFYRNFTFEEGPWSNIQRVYQSELNSSHPKIHIDIDGKIYVLWVQQYGNEMKTRIALNSRNEGETWPESYENVSRNTNSSARDPSFKIRQGNVYVCWEDNRNGTWDIFYSEKINNGWKNPVRLRNSGEKYWPSLALDQENNVHVIYNSNAGNIYYVKKIGKTWSSPRVISSASSPKGAMDLKVFKNNTLHAVWRQRTASGISIYYSRATPDGYWFDPLKVAEGKESDCPKIDLGDSGDAHIVWEDVDSDNKKDVFYAKVIPPGLTPTSLFTSSDDSGILPLTVVFDSSESTPGEGNIISYWWDFGDGTELRQGKYVSHTFSKAGNFTVKLYVTNSSLLVGFYSKKIEILPGPFPPTEILVRKAEEGGLFFREKVNILTWKENAKNKGQVLISFYNIYRKLKGQENNHFEKIGQADALAFKYIDRDFLNPEDRDLYSYAISAVDSQNREGPLGFALSSSSGEEKKTFKKRE